VRLSHYCAWSMIVVVSAWITYAVWLFATQALSLFETSSHADVIMAVTRPGMLR